MILVIHYQLIPMFCDNALVVLLTTGFGVQPVEVYGGLFRILHNQAPFIMLFLTCTNEVECDSHVQIPICRDIASSRAIPRTFCPLGVLQPSAHQPIPQFHQS